MPGANVSYGRGVYANAVDMLTPDPTPKLPAGLVTSTPSLGASLVVVSPTTRYYPVVCVSLWRRRIMWFLIIYMYFSCEYLISSRASCDRALIS